MEKNRLEAFSDGVIAIILTIMVLDLKVPKEHTLDALILAWPVFAAYSLSYWNVFLIWLNHHHIFSSLHKVDTALLGANGLLLFTASFIPFATAYASESHWTEPLPVFVYGLLMAVVSLAFAHLRKVAGKSASTPDVRARHLAEAGFSRALALTFMVGAVLGWFLPRSAIFLYALVPLGRRLYRRLWPRAA